MCLSQGNLSVWSPSSRLSPTSTCSTVPGVTEEGREEPQVPARWRAGEQPRAAENT